MTVETYTHDELDELVGASLFIGRLHNALASFLDATKYRDDVALFELMNLLPPECVAEILPTTTLLLSEMRARIDVLVGAIGSAVETTAELAADGNDEFAKIMRTEFGKDGKRNGG